MKVVAETLIQGQLLVLFSFSRSDNNNEEINE